IWVIGKLLAPAQSSTSIANRRDLSWSGRVKRQLPAGPSAIFRAVTLASLAGLFCARVLYASLEARDRTQTTPFFVPRIEDSRANKPAAVPRVVWNELHPTSGEYSRHETPELPGRGADCVQFFCKPSRW